jgi:hypothetical protein
MEAEFQPLSGFGYAEVLLGGFATLAIFSFLYRENSFYRFFEHVYIGIATAIGVMAGIRSFLWPNVFAPLFGYDRVVFPDGTYAAPYNQYALFFLIPVGFGLFYYFILSRRLSWLAQLVIGFSLGVSGGLAFKGTAREFLPQLFDSFRPLYIPQATLWTNIGNVVFIFTLITALSYFFFTFKRRPGGVIERSASAGRLMMMGCFGAFFGSTIMARMALLVERLEFLINQWWPALTGWIA